MRRDSLGRRIGRNWWREFICDALFNAEQAWQRHRESVAIGYATEEAEFAQQHPRPTLKALLISNAGLDKTRVM